MCYVIDVAVFSSLLAEESLGLCINYPEVPQVVILPFIINLDILSVITAVKISIFLRSLLVSQI